jgi:hypothetical protein
MGMNAASDMPGRRMACQKNTFTGTPGHFYPVTKLDQSGEALQECDISSAKWKRKEDTKIQIYREIKDPAAQNRRRPDEIAQSNQ